MYQPPPGVHVALWRYVGVNSGCANELSDGSARILGFAAVRPDRLRYDFDVTGHLLDMVNGNGVDLRYTYDTLGRLTSVYEPRTCTGTIGGLGCRAIKVSYPFSGYIIVTDPAGRKTNYMFDGASPMHLVEVFNSPEVQQGGNDHVIYTYMGVNDTGNLNANCNGDYGQLCSITDARGNVTLFSYGPSTLGHSRITGITDRRGTATTLTYHDTSPVYMNADTGNHRVLYYTIDAFGRAAQVGEGDTGNNYRHITDYTWDTAAAPCTYVDGSLQGSNTTWKRQDNNLCQLTPGERHRSAHRNYQVRLQSRGPDLVPAASDGWKRGRSVHDVRLLHAVRSQR